MRFQRTVVSHRWASPAASLAMFALLCATIAYWVLQLVAPPVPIAPTGSLVDHRDAPDLSTAAKLFGQPVGGTVAAAAATPGNIQVLGVAASETRGSAVLVVDGKPAKAFMVGDPVGENATLVEVRADAVVVDQNGARVELAAPRRPSVALLTAGPASSAPTAGARTPPVPTAAPASALPAAAPPPAGAAAATATSATPAPPGPRRAGSAAADPASAAAQGAPMPEPAEPRPDGQAGDANASTAEARAMPAPAAEGGPR